LSFDRLGKLRMLLLPYRRAHHLRGAREARNARKAREATDATTNLTDATTNLTDAPATLGELGRLETLGKLGKLRTQPPLLRELGKLTGATSVLWEQFRTRNYYSYTATTRS